MATQCKRPDRWPGKPTRRHYTKGHFAVIDDTGREWLDAAIDTVTVGKNQKQAKTDRRLLILVIQRMESGQEFAGSPFSSLSATSVAKALGCSQETARKALARLSAEGGPLVVLARPNTKLGDRWGAFYCPRCYVGKLAETEGAQE